VTEVTYFRWRPEYRRLKGDQVKRLKEPEVENTRLRRGAPDLTLDKLILKETPRETPELRASPHLRGARGYRVWRSERFACRMLGQHRSTPREKPIRPDDEAALMADIMALAIQFGRYV
jgi:hypothetical protein